REVHRIYHPLLERDPQEARRYLESFLLSVAVGVTPVHQIRRIDASFMSDYMLPQLEEDEVVGEVADRIVAPEGDSTMPLPKGADAIKSVANDPDFDQKHRKSLEAAFNKFKRATRDLEAALTKAKVLGA